MIAPKIYQPTSWTSSQRQHHQSQGWGKAICPNSPSSGLCHGWEIVPREGDRTGTVGCLADSLPIFCGGMFPGNWSRYGPYTWKILQCKTWRWLSKGISTSKGEKISWFVSGAYWESVVFHTQRLFLGSTGIPCHFFPSTRNQPKCLQILTQISVVGQFVHEPNNEKLPTNTPSQKQPSRLRPSRPNTSYPPET